jgi:DNA-binding NarL/FixJ family response regulator
VDALLAQVRALAADVVLLDGRVEGAVEFVRAVSAPPDEVGVVALGIASAAHALELLSAGALAYVDEEGTATELDQALAAAARGESVAPPRLVAELLRRTLIERRWSARGQPLTRREAEVAELLRAGVSNKAIAQRLQIEVSTVKNHVHSILVKLELHGRGEIGSWRPGVQPAPD